MFLEMILPFCNDVGSYDMIPVNSLALKNFKHLEIWETWNLKVIFNNLLHGMLDFRGGC